MFPFFSPPWLEAAILVGGSHLVGKVWRLSIMYNNDYYDIFNLVHSFKRMLVNVFKYA